MITISETTKDYAYSFIYKYHYSKVMPVHTKYYLLITIGGVDMGVITLGWGTQPLGTINKLFPGEQLNTGDYYEIGKMCFIPEINNGNMGSQIMSEIIKYIKNNIKIKFLYTLADGIMGKAGYIYQASNFTYIGYFDTLVYRDNNTGEKIHPRTAKELCKRNAEFLGKDKVFWLTYDFMEKENISKIQGKMYRYIYPITKEAKKLIKKYHILQNNPKKDDIKWYDMKSGKKIQISMPEFNMKYEEGYNRKNILLNYE